MSGCVEFQSSMTGSTRVGLLQPPEDSAPLPAGSSSSSSSLSSRSSSKGQRTLQSDEARMRQKMTPVRPPSSQPIQLTPLWEHVVSFRINTNCCSHPFRPLLYFYLTFTLIYLKAKEFYLLIVKHSSIIYFTNFRFCTSDRFSVNILCTDLTCKEYYIII